MFIFADARSLEATTTTACVADKGSVRRAAAKDQLFGPEFLGHKQFTEMCSRTVYRVIITDSVQGDTQTVYRVTPKATVISAEEGGRSDGQVTQFTQTNMGERKAHRR